MDRINEVNGRRDQVRDRDEVVISVKAMGTEKEPLSIPEQQRHNDKIDIPGSESEDRCRR